ncbi:MAG: Hsp20/alpha crystallin family protein [Desulfobacterales bacterium]
MEYIKIRFGNELDRLSSDFERAFDDLFSPANPMFTLSERKWHPQMDIYETPQEVIIIAAIAGVAKEDLDVEINRKAVKIAGQRQEIPKGSDATYRLAEIQYGSFERVLFLPAAIDPDVVSASFTNGILQIRLAKVAQNQIHKIPVSGD